MLKFKNLYCIKIQTKADIWINYKFKQKGQLVKGLTFVKCFEDVAKLFAITCNFKLELPVLKFDYCELNYNIRYGQCFSPEIDYMKGQYIDYRIYLRNRCYQ